MLNKIKKALNKLKSWEPSFDPSKFDDDVASMTRWTPLKKGGTNFGTHRLVQVRYDRIEFKSTLGAKAFSLIFLTIGVGVPVLVGTDMFRSGGSLLSTDLIMVFVFGLIFFVAGSWLFFSFTKPVVFDKTKGMFWKGWKEPKRYLAKTDDEISRRIGNIYALQIIPELVRSDNSSYVSYELNLVLRDGSRMNVIDHGNKTRILSDAQLLAEFLDISVWDKAK